MVLLYQHAPQKNETSVKTVGEWRFAGEEAEGVKFILLDKWVWRMLEEIRGTSGIMCFMQIMEGEGSYGGCSVWLQHLHHIKMGGGLLDDRWLSDNIIRWVGDGASTLFWKDTWLNGEAWERRMRLFA